MFNEPYIYKFKSRPVQGPLFTTVSDCHIMTSKFIKKVAVVTGSSSGFGAAIARMFAAEGACVTLCGRDLPRLTSVCEEIVKVNGGHPDRVLTIQGDITSSVVRKEIISETVAKFGKLDILLANAGIADVNQSLSAATEDTYDRTMDTNLKSVFFLIQEARPHLLAAQGSIVLLSSVCSLVPVPEMPVYAMTKAALDHLSHCLAVDLGPHGVRINSVNPGYIPTRIMRGFGSEVAEISQGFLELEFQKQPIKTRQGLVSDVVEAVSFLASGAAGFITGQHLSVDGGRNLTGTLRVIDHP